jgi:hypothetical protein
MNMNNNKRFEMSGTIIPMTERHIPDLNQQRKGSLPCSQEFVPILCQINSIRTIPSSSVRPIFTPLVA